jgi:ABC-type lipoprotein export system ATPase subunit
MDNSRGSEWKKCDLHVHTPASMVQWYGGDNEASWEKFIQDLENLPPEFKILGINDYLFIEGYKRLKKEKEQNHRLQNIDLLLPVIEFRIEKFAGVEFGSLNRINFHVIFSDEVPPEIIESQFLATLQQHYVLESTGKEWNRTINKQSMSELGAAIRATVPQGELDKFGTDAIEGFNNINIKEEQIMDALKSDCFNDKYLTAVGKTEWDSLSWSDSSIATKKSIINGVDLVFTSAESIDSYNRAKQKLTAQGVNDILLDCSDAHRFSEDTNKDRIGNSLSWVKADSTFEGLKQILYEPEDRIYTGNEPPVLERVRSNKTKYIDSLIIDQKSSYDGSQGTWFKSVNIKFNKELVAIIGNKGSCKSALSDIIGVLGNTHNGGIKQENLSFLNASALKFRKRGYAENFHAELIWEDTSGKGITIPLDHDIDINQAEKVKYLPQNYFENLTNDLEGEGFEDTLKSVIFLHLPEEQRLATSKFSELEDLKTQIIEKDLVVLREELHKLSSEIIKLEVKKHPNYRKQLESLIAEKQKELDEHEKNKPAQVPDPSSPEDLKIDSVKQENYTKLANLNTEHEKIITLIQSNREELNTLVKDQEELTQLNETLTRLETGIETFKTDYKSTLEKFNLKLDEVVSVTFDKQSINTKIKSINQKITESKNLFKTKTIIDSDPSMVGQPQMILDAYKASLIVQQGVLQEKISDITKLLSQPEKDFQEYKDKIVKWEAKKKEIEGSLIHPNSLIFLNKEKEYLDKFLSVDLLEKRNERLKKVLEVFRKKQEIIQLYILFKKAIDKEISKDDEFTNKFKMEIDVNFKIDPHFAGNFLQYINKSKRGTFLGASEKEVQDIFAEKDLLSEQDITNILNTFVELLENDKRESDLSQQSREISDQVERVQDFYDYIFSLEYLHPIYELKLDEKTLDELSPGEKGALLLVFYLMIDKEDIPLVIDQPEDNLDNKSVFQVLTHFIKNAKKRRQIIIVTHNPNLAVGADAEQIIYVELDKKDGLNIFSSETGSIENPMINKRIVEILEGTMPAFDKRRLRYFES